MDLTLFIVLVFLSIIFIYFTNILNNLRKDIRNMNICANVSKKENIIDDKNNIIDNITHGLSYLKNYL